MIHVNSSTLKNLSEYSKEELINIIERLQAENTQLRFEGGYNDVHSAADRRLIFKKGYAENILDALPDMLTVVTEEGNVVEVVSSEATNHSGISIDQIHGVHLNAFLSDTVTENVMKGIAQAKVEGESDVVVHPIDFDDERHYLENRTVRIDSDYYLCLCRDITEEVRVKQQLENVSYALDYVDENIFAVTSEGKFIFANKQFVKDHEQSYPVEELVYDVMFSVKNIDEWERLKEKLRANNGTLNYISDPRTDRPTNTYEIVAKLIYDENGNETFWFFARNISLRLEQETKIKELNDIMGAILNNIPVYLFVKDTADDFRYLYWNKAFENHSGIPATRAVGNTDFDIFPNIEDAHKFREDDLRLVRNKTFEECIEKYQSEDLGTRIVKTVKLLVPREDSEPLLIGVSWDITDIKKTEQELIEAKLEAEQSNRLKSAFIANMSHEIRTPLNAIVGFSRLISTADDPEEKQQFSDIIESNADLLLQLINDILDLSKIEAGTLEFIDSDVDLEELCGTMLEVHRTKAKEGVALLFDNPGEELIVKCDRNRLTQVFTNLITNALKFTDSGQIRFGYELNNDRVEVYVSDTGMGIPEDKLASVFDRFVKLNAFAQGTGLGLSITRMIVERIGGEITVSSTEGKGAEFRFTIPYQEIGLIEENATADLSIVEETPLVIEEKIRKTVLIVEDDKSNYVLLKSYIKQRYICHHAWNGQEAIDLFQQHSPDLILMDMKMPVMDGIEATKRIRSISDDVPIVALTAYAYETDKERALASGCNRFLTKPVSFPVLEQVFAEYLDM